MDKGIDSGRKCVVCGEPIIHFEHGSGRYRWRYCDDWCAAEGARWAAALKRGRRPIRRTKPPKSN